MHIYKGCAIKGVLLLFCVAMKRNAQRLNIFIFMALAGLSVVVQIFISRNIFSESAHLPLPRRNQYIFPTETNLPAPYPVENGSYASVHLQHTYIHNSSKASYTSLTSNITISAKHVARSLSERHQQISPLKRICQCQLMSRTHRICQHFCHPSTDKTAAKLPTQVSQVTSQQEVSLWHLR